MAERGGQPGNNNAERGKRWRDAIAKAIEERSRQRKVDAIEQLAEKLLSQCDEGNIVALKELGDRLDGKAAQSVMLSGDEDNPIKTKWTIEVVHAKDTDT